MKPGLRRGKSRLDDRGGPTSPYHTSSVRPPDFKEERNGADHARTRSRRYTTLLGSMAAVRALTLTRGSDIPRRRGELARAAAATAHAHAGPAASSLALIGDLKAPRFLN